jgi:flavin-dependent dehydrogenase
MFPLPILSRNGLARRLDSERSMMREVEIIGGGLSGLGIGIALRREGIPVTVHEAGHYPRHRVCGEFVTSLDRQTMKSLLLEEIFAQARPARLVAWCEDGKPEIVHRLPQAALCLSRHTLDRAMAERFVELGGDLRTGSRAADTARPGTVHAGGRQPCTESRWVGIKQHFRGLETRSDLEVHFGEGGYIGLTKVDDETTNVCGLLLRESANLKQPLAVVAEEAGFRALSLRLSAGEPVPGSACAVAALDYRRRHTDSGALRIGDRGGMIPPFTGNGMTIALQSGAASAPHVAAWARGQTSWRQTCENVRRAHESRFGLRLRVASLLHPLLLRSSVRSGARALHRRGVLPVGFLYRLMH